MDDYAIQVYKDVLSGSLKRFPHNFWQDDQGKNFADSAIITRYLIEEILKWDDETIKQQICCKTFFTHKLKGMLCVLYGDSVYAALNRNFATTEPKPTMEKSEKFKQWELTCTPRNFWNLETARDATIWLFRDVLKLSDEQILQSNSRKIFVDNGLDTMMHILFNNNASKAIENAFPELMPKTYVRK